MKNYDEENQKNFEDKRFKKKSYWKKLDTNNSKSIYKNLYYIE